MIELGRPYRSRRPLQELLAGQLFEASPHEPGAPIPISTGGFIARADFEAHCELAGTVADDGRLCADVRHAGLFFIATGWTQDFNEMDRHRSGREQLPLEHAVLVCRLLATGEAQKARSEFNGHVVKHEWTSVDLSSMPAKPLKPAEQPVWFHPGRSDYSVLRLQSAGLIHAFSAELNWLLRHTGLPERAQLEAMLVLLDQAMIRCGL